jgi:hypothetical protein
MHKLWEVLIVCSFAKKKGDQGNSFNCKCGEPTKLQLVMEDCTNKCKQNYSLYLSDDQGACDILKEDTLPLLFALHCLGCTLDCMMRKTEVMDEFNFVLVYVVDQCASAKDKLSKWSSQINGLLAT